MRVSGVVGMQGVVLTRDAEGRPTGEAFLQVPSAEAQSQALQLNRARMGSRYIEIFVASWPDMQQVPAQPVVLILTGQDGTCRGKCSARVP